MTLLSWRTFGAPVEPDDGTPTADFAFVSDPLALLTSDQVRELREDLADLSKLRREVEAECASLRLG